MFFALQLLVIQFWGRERCECCRAYVVCACVCEAGKLEAIQQALKDLPTMKDSLRPGATKDLEAVVVSKIEKRFHSAELPELEAYLKALSDAGKRRPDDPWLGLSLKALQLVQEGRQRAQRAKVEELCGALSEAYKEGNGVAQVHAELIRHFDTVPLFDPRDEISTMMLELGEVLLRNLPVNLELDVEHVEGLSRLGIQLLEALIPHLGLAEADFQKWIEAARVMPQWAKLKQQIVNQQSLGTATDKDGKTLQAMVQQRQLCNESLEKLSTTFASQNECFQAMLTSADGATKAAMLEHKKCCEEQISAGRGDGQGCAVWHDRKVLEGGC